jgi:hypothetical protein
MRGETEKGTPHCEALKAPSLIAGHANDPRVKTVTARQETAAMGRLGERGGNRDIYGFGASSGDVHIYAKPQRPKGLLSAY